MIPPTESHASTARHDLGGIRQWKRIAPSSAADSLCSDAYDEGGPRRSGHTAAALRGASASGFMLLELMLVVLCGVAAEP